MPRREPLIIRAAVWSAAALAAALVVCAGDYAKAAEAPPTKRVFIGDLNLRASAGQKTALRRVTIAAREVCGASYGVLAYNGFATRNCIRVAVADAMSQALPATTLAQNRP